MFLGYGDTAGFLEMTSKESFLSPLSSDYFSSTVIVSELYRYAPDRICERLPFVDQFNKSVISGHPYLIAVPLKAVSAVLGIDSRWTGSAAMSASIMVGLLSLASFFVKSKSKKSLWIVFLLSVVIFPLVTRSMLGQSYFDKLLFGPTIFVILQVHQFFERGKIRPYRTIAALVIMALISERGALLAAMLVIAPTILFASNRSFLNVHFRKVIFMGLGSLSWCVIWFVFFQSFSYGNVSLAEVVDNITYALTHLNSEPYITLVILLMPYLFISVFAGRWSILIFLCLIPNIGVPLGLLNINNYYSHYFQILIPVLIGVSAIGISNISGLRNRLQIYPRWVKAHTTLTHCLVGLFGLLILTCWSSPKISEGRAMLQQPEEIWLPFFSDEFENKKTQANTLKDLGQSIVSLVGPDKSLSATEGLMPTLEIAGITNIEYFPGGVGAADFVLVSSENGNPMVLPFADPQGSTESLVKCVSETISSEYRLVKDFGEVFGMDLALYEHKSRG